jgi:hypothetical protein
VTIRYSSDTQVVAVMVSIADDVFVTLTDLASDNGFVPYDVTFLSLRDLASQISVPPVSPVLLRWVNDALGGIQRFLRLWFSTNRLARLMLSPRYADVSGRQITPQVQLVQMDIVFDLVDSCDADTTKRQITGYVYGSFQFRSVQAILFVAGTKNSTRAEFWSHLSAHPVVDFDSRALLEMKPQDVTADGQLMDQQPPSDDWNMPSSYSVSTATVYANTSASLHVKFIQVTGAGSYNLQELKLEMFINTSWTVYDGLILSSGSFILSLVNPLGQANMTGFVLLAGSFVATVRITQYLVSLEMKCSRSKPAGDTTFWAMLQVGQVTSSGITAAPASAIATLPAFRSLTLDQDQRAGKIPDRFRVCFLFAV